MFICAFVSMCVYVSDTRTYTNKHDRGAELRRVLFWCGKKSGTNATLTMMLATLVIWHSLVGSFVSMMWRWQNIIQSPINLGQKIRRSPSSLLLLTKNRAFTSTNYGSFRDYLFDEGYSFFCAPRSLTMKIQFGMLFLQCRRRTRY